MVLVDLNLEYKGDFVESGTHENHFTISVIEVYKLFNNRLELLLELDFYLRDNPNKCSYLALQTLSYNYNDPRTSKYLLSPTNSTRNSSISTI
jgi:hypothetical protein